MIEVTTKLRKFIVYYYNGGSDIVWAEKGCSHTEQEWNLSKALNNGLLIKSYKRIPGLKQTTYKINGAILDKILNEKGEKIK